MNLSILFSQGRGRFTTDVLHEKSKKSNSGKSENLRKPAEESEGKFNVRTNLNTGIKQGRL